MCTHTHTHTSMFIYYKEVVMEADKFQDCGWQAGDLELLEEPTVGFRMPGGSRPRPCRCLSAGYRESLMPQLEGRGRPGR